MFFNGQDDLGVRSHGRLIAAARSKHLALNVTVRERCLRRACGSALARGSDPPATIRIAISVLKKYNIHNQTGPRRPDADKKLKERKRMNNKKGGAGGIVLLVLILMIASAVGGAYAYRVADGKMASKDAMKAVEQVDISDYDTAEQTIIQGYIDKTTKDLETAQTRKQVYEILSEFISDVDKVQTKKEKELAQALKDAEDAKKKYEQQNNNTNNNNNTNGNSSQNPNDNNGSGSNNDSNGSGGYKSNELTSGEDSSGSSSNGFLDSLLGGLASGAN